MRIFNMKPDSVSSVNTHFYFMSRNQKTRVQVRMGGGTPYLILITVSSYFASWTAETVFWWSKMFQCNICQSGRYGLYKDIENLLYSVAKILVKSIFLNLYKKLGIHSLNTILENISELKLTALYIYICKIARLRAYWFWKSAQRNPILRNWYYTYIWKEIRNRF